MRPVVIGVDARELLGDRTGVGHYLGELMRRWTTRDDAARRHFILYTPERLEISLPQKAADVRVVPGARGTWWEQTSLSGAIRRDAVDVFFAPAYTAPVSLGAPLAVTIHDVSFSRHPEWFRPREGARRRWLTKHAARRAGVILTVSDFSRREIMDLYGVPGDRIAVVHNGVTPRMGGATEDREPIVLYAGSIFNRRNVPALIEAFALVAREAPAATLVIVGDNRTYPHQDLEALVSRHQLGNRISLRSYVPDNELASLYARASVFVFLSDYEGFGLTPLEALTAGVPIVVADTAVSREIYGAAAAFAPSHDTVAISRAITRLLTSPAARDTQLAQAPAVLARYSWDACAEATLAHIERVARR